MIRSRKAQMGFLGQLIIALASFAVIVSLFVMCQKQAERVYDLRACHDTLLTEDVVFKKVGEYIPGGETKKPWPSSCQTIGPIVIEDKDPETVMRKIADKMVHCWWSLGRSGDEGFDPFAKNWFDWLKPETACFSCYSIKVENVDIDMVDFNLWLVANHLDNDESKPTYWNYFMGTMTEGGVTLEKTHELPPITGDIKKGNYYSLSYMDYRATIYDKAATKTRDEKPEFCRDSKVSDLLARSVLPMMFGDIYEGLCGPAMIQKTQTEEERTTTEDGIFLMEWNFAQEEGCQVK
ncbi:MAG: hypothetical protein KKE20_04110 [Nanoarchaeota archaeon]|nr:hypothetical protein [Nanoarchaeota archaeon]